MLLVSDRETHLPTGIERDMGLGLHYSSSTDVFVCYRRLSCLSTTWGIKDRFGLNCGYRYEKVKGKGRGWPNSRPRSIFNRTRV